MQKHHATSTTKETSDCFALLIGADYYLPNTLPDGNSYKPLAGCVQDSIRTKHFLIQTLALPEHQIMTLQASHTNTSLPPEPPEQWPTYENMVAAFHKLTTRVHRGDQVYIHYSGHGGRTCPTLFPELKGENGIDEALVPIDIGSSTARYLRDIELAYLLKTMVDKGLLVTLVLDCCHSGGATRDASNNAVRGINTVDTTIRPTESLVASHEALAQTWHLLTANPSRGLVSGSLGLPEVKEYVLLAACRSTEQAYEHRFYDTGTQGVFTYWLLDALKQLRPGLTYKHLHDRILPKVHSDFALQTPQLQGDGERTVFGNERLHIQHAITIMQVDTAQQRLLLNTGQVHGVREGTLFAVYPPGTIDFVQSSSRQALVEITEPGATDSWARIHTRYRPEEAIEQGAQAVMINLGSLRLHRKVQLIQPQAFPADSVQSKALEQVAWALQKYGHGFVSLAALKEMIDFQVAVTANSVYEILDTAGEPLPYLQPVPFLTEENAAAQLVQQLLHLTRYRNIQQLENAGPSRLNGLVVELVGRQTAYTPPNRPNPQPFSDSGHSHTLHPGEWTFLRLKNTSPQALNITILDLKPDWSITQIFPAPYDTSYLTFDPGQEVLLPLQAYLPQGYTEAVDTLKVFATISSTDFRWLELPPLGHPSLPENQSRLRAPSNPLEALLALFNAAEAQTRHLTLANYATPEWITVQVEVRVSSI